MPSDQQPEQVANPDPKTAQAVAKLQPPPFTTGGKLAPLIPHNIDEAWRLSKYIAESGLAPSSMRQPAQIMAAIMAGAEVGLPPLQAVQSIAIINGRPAMWGDGLLAIVLARKVKVEEWMTGTGDERVAYCKVTRPDTKQVIERYFSVEDAKEAKLWGKKGRDGQDTPWITYPRRMLQMRARSWAIRDGAADITRGIMVREEVEDFDEGAVVTKVGPTVATYLATDVAAGDDAKIDVVDATYEEQGATDEARAATDEAPGETPPADGPGESPPPQEIEVRQQASGMNPSDFWITQVREAFEATKTREQMKALEARWTSRANKQTLADIREQAPEIADELEREYEALEQMIRGGK